MYYCLLVLGDGIQELLVLSHIVNVCQGQHRALGAHLVVHQLLLDAQLYR